MKNRWIALLGLLLATISVTALAIQAPAGQAAQGAGAAGRGGGRGGAAAAPAGPVPRAADGKPDLSGAWLNSYNVGLQNIQTARGVIVEPTDGRIPYKPDWAERARDTATNRMFEEPELHCFLSGVPHIIYIQFGFQIVSTPERMVMLWEFMNAYRVISMDGRPHIHPDVKLFMGDSTGRWEGDTLVIDTRNQNSRTWFDTAGAVHSDALHVIERFTMTDANTIRYEATLEDPIAFTGPMKVTETLRRNPMANWETMEFACIEGNKDVDVYPTSAGGRSPNAPSAAPAEFATPPRGGGGRGGAPAGRGQQ